VGFFILRGLNRFFNTEIVLGTALSVILAVAVDLVLVLVERLLTPWTTERAAEAS
jgi:osmoprotectant transport system permease protein